MNDKQFTEHIVLRYEQWQEWRKWYREQRVIYLRNLLAWTRGDRYDTQRT